MPCHVFGGSCSLCPWCGEEYCPHFHDHDNDKRYWVYVVDRKESCYNLLANLDTKEEVIAFVKKLVNRKWAKKYRLAQFINTKIIRGSMYKSEWGETPYVEITITDGEYSWNNDISLVINTEDKSISYYNIWKTKFHPYVDKGEDVHVEIVKPWDGKVNFIDHRKLPWYPTPEEWEEKRKK